ncbi:M16 family metallopeptidase [Archangium lipolyticum]|uniref:M16 family metallopeptidase n=1 Tax=Archangium lipolyticum TaxID=2970465 RepID=UPI002149B0E3|nr:insulinase family protein [Archangium lipolyticum]
MPRRLSILLALYAALPFSALTGCATTPAPRATSRAYRGSSTEYANGLRLLVHEDPNASQTTLLVSYRVGAVDDPPGKEGLAYLAARFTQAAAFATGHSPHPLRELEAKGVRAESRRDHDTTSFMFSTPSEQLSPLMEVEAWRMRDPLANLSEATFLDVRDELVEELRQSQNAELERLAVGMIQRQLLPGHPYGRPTEGTPESIGRLTLDDVRAFVKQHYTPAAAVVAVAGPRPLGEVRSEVERLFPGLRDTSRTERLSPVQSQPPSFPKVPPKDKGLPVISGPVVSPLLYLVWVAPGYSSGKNLEGDFAEFLLGAVLRYHSVAPGIRVFRYRLDGVSLIIAELGLHERGDVETVLDSASSAINKLVTPYYVRRLTPMTQQLARAMLVQQAEQFPLMEATRLWHTTGRADYLNLRKQQIESLSDQVMLDYLRTYLRFDQARVFLVVKSE